MQSGKLSILDVESVGDLLYEVSDDLMLDVVQHSNPQQYSEKRAIIKIKFDGKWAKE